MLHICVQKATNKMSEKKNPYSICAVIPTYNNGKTIADVIRRTYNYLKDIIVVVDGCTDDTEEQLAKLGLPSVVVRQNTNKGKGAALKKGFQKAIELGFDYALTIDSDGQHYPEDIPAMLKALSLHPGALIVGSRNLQAENMPGKNQFANKFSNFWFRLQTHVALPDTQTGMRIYPIRRLRGLSLLTSRYEAELELLVLAAWHNIPLVPVPIRVYYPPKEERVSHFRPARDFTRISLLNTVLCVGAIVYGYPMMYWRTVVSFGVWVPAMLVINIVATVYWLLFGRVGSGVVREKRRLRGRKCLNSIARWFTRNIPGLDFQIINPQHHKFGEKPMLYICNHQSVLEVVPLFALTEKLVILTKGWVWYNPLLGVVLRLCNCLPVTKDNEQNIEKLSKLVEQGYSVVVFPEGTRTRTGDIGRFHRGACYMAERLGLDICPLLLEGMFDVLSKNEFRIRPGKVTLTVLPTVGLRDASFGEGYRQRTKTLELYYRNRIGKAFDKSVCVLGAGVGGLFTAALLAEQGYTPIVLEQLPVAGGGMYSYQRLGHTWQTGTHVVCGMGEGELIGDILRRLGIEVPYERTEFDHDPSPLIGEQEYTHFANSAYRLTDGAAPIVQGLCLYITRHGGRILLEEKVTHLTVGEQGISAVETEHARYECAKVVSTLHPKQLLRLTDTPLFRPITTERILKTPETRGVFKLHIVLKDNAIAYDRTTHYLPAEQILCYTSGQNEAGQAQTMECIQACDYAELDAWKTDRKADYAAYEAYKERKAQSVLSAIEQIYPNLRNSVAEYFSATSLTYRDDYLTPEGAMYGMAEPVGRVTTQIRNLYLGGQNCYLHGIYGTVYTAAETVKEIRQHDQQ